MNGPTRLLIVLLGGAIALWWLVPEYVRSFGEIRQQFRDGAAHRHDDGLAGRQIVRCNSSIWSDRVTCDPNSIGARNHSGREPIDIFGFRRRGNP